MTIVRIDRIDADLILATLNADLLDSLGEANAVVIALSSSITLHNGLVQLYSAIRFFGLFTGTGMGEFQVDWQLIDGTSIQASPESIVLSAGYLEVPVRAPRVLITANETGGVNPVTLTGEVSAIRTP